MDNLVKLIVDMDKNLRNLVLQEQSRLQEQKDSVKQEGQKVREGYCAQAHKRISIIRQQNDEFIKDKYRQTEDRYVNAKDKLESAFENNHSKWVDEIVIRCLKN